MGRVLDEGKKADDAGVGSAVTVPIGGFVDAVRGGAYFKPVGAILPRSEFPELSAAYPAGASRYTVENLSPSFSFASYANDGNVASDGDRWVLNTGSTLYYSDDDGDTWTAAAATRATHDVAYGGGVYVTGCIDGYVNYSTDGGVSYSEVKLGTETDDVDHVVYGDGVFLAATTSHKSVYRSENGRDWEQVASPAFDASDLTALGYGHGIFVAGSGNGATETGEVAVSADGGTTWDLLGNALGEEIFSFAFSDALGRWVAVGDKGSAFYSDDDFLSVTPITFPGSPDDLTAVESDGGPLFVVVGIYDYGAYSRDGVTWTELSGLGAGANFGACGTNRRGVWLAAQPSSGLYRMKIQTPDYVLLDADPAETRLVRVK